MMILREPNLQDEAVLRQAHNELAAEGHSGFLLHGYQDDSTDFIKYIGAVRDFSIGENLPIGMVRETFLVSEIDSEIVGRISIRHELNQYLLNFGGHIGYMVRPGFRMNGYASEMLRRALLVSKDIGLNQVLITCNDDNIGSIQVIEKHGGVLENKVDEEGRLLRRYWIRNA
jgi:predicted acetyltransferase